MSQAPSAPQPEPDLDLDALRYDEHWEPVLHGATVGLLSRLDAFVQTRLEMAGPPPTLLDVGSGTGALILSASERWSAVRCVGLDASAAMLGVARQRAVDAGVGRAALVPEWHVADAAKMPLEGGSVSVAASSFMLQLVQDRAAVLAEVRRVLVPGGAFGLVTWLAEDLMLTADEEFDEAVFDLDLDDPEGGFREAKSGDFENVEQARHELHEAGFIDIDARADELRHSWTRAAFLDFKRLYDERELFESLDADDQARLARRVTERWASLSDEAFTLRAPIVTAVATRPWRASGIPG
jgi:SAM-dependent methyltransferase